MSGSDRPWNGDDRGEGASEGRADGSDEGVLTRRRLAAAGVLCAGVAVVVLLGAYLVYSVTTLGCACQPPGQSVTVDWTYHADDGSLTGTHAGGDRLDENNTERLVVRVDGESRGTVLLPLTVEDEFRVPDVSPGDEVLLVWEGPNGESSQVIASHVVPTNTSPNGTLLV